MKESDRRPIVRLALTRAELALSIGMSVGSIDKMVEEGVLPPPRRWHTRKLWLVTEVEAALLDLPVDGEVEANPWDEVLEGPRALTARQQKNIRETLEKLEYRSSLPEAERQALHQQEERDWEAAILKSPMSVRERTVLKQLAEAGVGTKLNTREIKGGSDAFERLKLRGYADLNLQPRHPDRHHEYWATQEGVTAWLEVKHLPTMGPRRKSEKKPKRDDAPQRRGKGYVRPYL
jgi:hypothetical protein